ncbi:hypothetical protein OH492_28145 [Vibrio chagasii]|nr:hypothetical protein [Vibrio chagasii]
MLRLSDGRFFTRYRFARTEGCQALALATGTKYQCLRNKTVVTEPYVDVATNDLVVTIASPFQYQRNSGVISADLNLNTLINDVVVSIGRAASVYAFLVDGNVGGCLRDRDLTLKSVANVSQNLSANKIKKSLSPRSGFEEMSIDGMSLCFQRKSSSYRLVLHCRYR